MLLKKQGVYEVSKLRAILLFEADFNQNNKCLGQAMMYQAEDLQLLAEEQFGSRKRHSAIDHCLNKVLMFDLSRLTRSTLTVCSNNAKGCYDRIVHSIACMSMLPVGVPKEPIVCMFTTLQNLRHHVRTILETPVCHSPAVSMWFPSREWAKEMVLHHRCGPWLVPLFSTSSERIPPCGGVNILVIIVVFRS